MKIKVQPALLRWARERAGLEISGVSKRVGVVERTVERWETTGEITEPQIHKLAHATHTPLGYLFLPEPPFVGLPIADLRTRATGAPTSPSTELIDTIHACQRRQGWYRDYLRREGAKPLAFVGSAQVGDDPAEIAERIRATLGLSDRFREQASSWQDAYRVVVDRAEGAGILVVRNGVVGNNTWRALSPDEFQGFCLSDDLAPLVFVNASDAKAAQMFTLAHEIAHVWLGTSGVTDAGLRSDRATERFCNAVAANILVPLGRFRELWVRGADPQQEARRLASVFRVSYLTMLIRAHEDGLVDEPVFVGLYGEEATRLSELERKKGGNHFTNQNVRLGKPFARAVIASALEGTTPYTEAFSLLEVENARMFGKLAEHMGGRGLMGYVLDADAFIQSNERHYSLDICPGYWDWVCHAHSSLRIVRSVESIREELSRQEDELWAWAGVLPNGFFAKPDLLVYAASTSLAAWAQAEDQFEDAARAKFFGSGEFLLISHAMAHGETVVSYERSRPDARARITVPDACKAVGVECLNPFQMLRREKVKFLLERGSRRKK